MRSKRHSKRDYPRSHENWGTTALALTRATLWRRHGTSWLDPVSSQTVVIFIRRFVFIIGLSQFPVKVRKQSVPYADSRQFELARNVFLKHAHQNRCLQMPIQCGRRPRRLRPEVFSREHQLVSRQIVSANGRMVGCCGHLPGQVVQRYSADGVLH